MPETTQPALPPPFKPLSNPPTIPELLELLKGINHEWATIYRNTDALAKLALTEPDIDEKFRQWLVESENVRYERAIVFHNQIMSYIQGFQTNLDLTQS